MARHGLLLVLLVLSLAACGGAGSTKVAPSTGNAAAGGDQDGIIVTVQGDASIKRAGWQNYAPAFFGAPLRKGDLLRLAASARAVVACADLKLTELPAGVSGFPCETGASQGALVYAGRLASPTRGEPSTGEYPVVVSPRKTKLLEPRPALRWTAVPGATAYRVSLQGTDWSTAIDGATETAYPADAPALKPGTAYRLVVEAGNGHRLRNRASGWAFSYWEPARPRRSAPPRRRSEHWACQTRRHGCWLPTCTPTTTCTLRRSSSWIPLPDPGSRRCCGLSVIYT